MQMWGYTGLPKENDISQEKEPSPAPLSLLK